MKINIEPEWHEPSGQITLDPNEVHIWRAVLDVTAPRVRVFESLLSPDERLRAAQFRFPSLRRRFITGRGILRELLGKYIHIAPTALQFEYTTYGKPFLANEQNVPQLTFNVAHTAGMGLYAIARTRLVGIDIEALRHVADATMIAERFFSAQEQRALRALPVADRSVAFLRYWTQKEAYIKAQGMGLSLPLDQFSITLTSGEPTLLQNINEESTYAKQWMLREISIPLNYVAAVAAEGTDWQMTYWQWPENTADSKG